MTASVLQAIAIVRHGETDWNRARRIQGRTEVPLNETGRRQAEATGRFLASPEVRATWGQWAHVQSSPLSRAFETAQIIGTTLGLTSEAARPTINDALWERNFGEAEGIAVDEAHQRWPGLHDIPGAEPLDELAARTAQAFESLLEASPGAIVVAHGAMIRNGLSRISGTVMPRIHNGETWVLYREAGPARSLGLVNLGTAHPAQ
jgi:uncharacterized phosphatase